MNPTTRSRLRCYVPRPLAVAVLAPLLLIGWARADEEVIFYSTYGYQEGTDWVVPLRLKVQEARIDANALGKLFALLNVVEARARENYVARAADFVADDESNQHVRIRFDEDPAKETFSILGGSGGALRTGFDGIADGTVRITAARVQQIRSAQGSTDGWLTFSAASNDHAGRGRVRLIDPAGISLVSDIDDTIKVTEVPAGKRTLAFNTFCRDFVRAPELSEHYTRFPGAAVHYVSGGPWQLYRPIAAFISASSFPDGSFHMRVVGGSILTASRSLEALGDFISPAGTFDHKVEQISRLMTRFPKRVFVLIGDSGEKDPEVYATVRTRFPAQVQEIVIRDVVDARTNDSGRLAGMTVVAAPNVVRREGRPLP